MLFCFIRVISAIMSAELRVRPVRGFHSCRLTPRREIACPLIRYTPSTISTRRKPTRVETRSTTDAFASRSSTTSVYSSGRSADQSRGDTTGSVSYTHLRAHETRHDLVCRLLL